MLQTERPELEVNLLVASVDAAAVVIVQAGGIIIEAPFDIQIGRCAVVQDLWDNRLVILDVQKGMLATDAQSNVIGNLPAQAKD